MPNPLLDKNFLKQLDRYEHKEKYARIQLLNFDEIPVQWIEGKVTGGSINIDGKSAVRRTCNLTMTAEGVDLNTFLWNQGTKFKLEIGLKNMIDSQYPDIIWFKQGIFVITSFNSTLSGNAFNISLSGQDKMCLLNGSFGGSLPSSIDFGKIDEIENKYIEKTFSDSNTYEAGKYYIANFVACTEASVFNPKTIYYIQENDQYNKIVISETDFNKEKTKYYNIQSYNLSYAPYADNQTYYELSSILVRKDLNIRDIIKNAVHVYGKEPYYNIVINDLQDLGLELLEYRGDKPMYFIYNANGEKEAKGACEQIIDQPGMQEKEFWYKNNESAWEKKDNIFKISNFQYVNDLKKVISGSETASTIKFSESGNEYYVMEVDYGKTIGYRGTELTYVGDLVSSIGESLTSILDKIKNMLGMYEYFYDIDGRFIFQKRKDLTRITWNTVSGDPLPSLKEYEESAISYCFNDAQLISQYSHTPDWNNLKNDYSVWGTRRSSSGVDLPIHARYAIHTKPIYYKTYDENVFQVGNNCDWREIIYQMSIDFYKNGEKADFYRKVEEYNTIDEEYLYPNGITGYEMFYTDMQAFWRQLYNPEDEGKLIYEKGCYEDARVPIKNNGTVVEKVWKFPTKLKYIFDFKRNGITIPRGVIYGPKAGTKCWSNSDIDSGSTAFAAGTWPISMKTDEWACWTNSQNKIWYCSSDDIIDYNDIAPDYKYDNILIKATLLNHSIEIISNNIKNDGWHYNVYQAPDALNFWIDFYDANNELIKYSINTIGDRPKVVNDSKVSSVYYQSTPDVIFINPEDKEITRQNVLNSFGSGYQLINMPQFMQEVFTISGQGKGAVEEIESLFNKHSYYSETIGLTAIPIYYLEPNSVIEVYNQQNKINGKFAVNRITLPLVYNGMMTINATKIIDTGN